MENAVLRDHTAAASASARELASRLDAIERLPVHSVSYDALVVLNDLAVKCGCDLLRLRASVFAERRNHNVALEQAAIRHNKEGSAAKQRSSEQKEVAMRDFEATRDLVKRKAEEEYNELCKLYCAKRPDFEAMKVAMPHPPSFSEAASSQDTGVRLKQALSDWDSQMVTTSPDAKAYGWLYAGTSVVTAYMMQNLAIGLFLGLIAPVAMYLLVERAKAKLRNFALALAQDGARIAKRMEDPVSAATKRWDARRAEIDAGRAKELAELEKRQAYAMHSLESAHVSVMSGLQQAASALDTEMLGLLDRVKRFESVWQQENRQAVAAFSEKPLEWEVPAPRLLRLGSLSMTAQVLVHRASQ